MALVRINENGNLGEQLQTDGSRNTPDIAVNDIHQDQHSRHITLGFFDEFVVLGSVAFPPRPVELFLETGREAIVNCFEETRIRTLAFRSVDGSSPRAVMTESLSDTDFLS